MKFHYFSSTGDSYFHIRSTNMVPLMFSIYFPKYEKLKSFEETFTPHFKILIYVLSNIFDTDQTLKEILRHWEGWSYLNFK